MYLDLRQDQQIDWTGFGQSKDIILTKPPFNTTNTSSSRPALVSPQTPKVSSPLLSPSQKFPGLVPDSPLTHLPPIMGHTPLSTLSPFMAQQGGTYTPH